MTEDHIKNFKELNGIGQDAPAESKRQRGIDFESLLNDIFLYEKILINRGYHTADNRSEQIDGAIKVASRIFLVETKWVHADLAASELYSFIGKVDNKFHGTLGVFISRNRLTDNFIRALNRGRRQSVIVIHGEDIDLLFEHKLSFTDYIEKAFTILSYDNISHYPVQDYLNNKQTAPASVPQVPVQASPVSEFIKEHLAKGLKTGTDILLESESLTETEQFEVYKYILNSYSRFWDAELKNLKFIITRNFDAYLEVCPPTPAQLQAYAGTFYSEIAPKSLHVYSRKEFSAPFSKFYEAIDQSQKKIFESFISECMISKFDHYDSENHIVGLIEHIWPYFNDDTKDGLASFVYQIFISYRLDKFAQKQFANRLVISNGLGSERLRDWLDQRIKINLDNYSYEEGDSQSKDFAIRFIVSTYIKLAAAMDLEGHSFADYVRSRVAFLDGKK